MSTDLAWEEPAPWPEDVPPPTLAPDDAEDEIERLGALYREEQRQRGIEAPAPAAPWEPAHPLARALWAALPVSGQGVEYWRFVRTVAAGTYEPSHVQQALLALVLVGRVYCTHAPEAGYTSLVGRGDDPRCGAGTYRAGALEGLL